MLPYRRHMKEISPRTKRLLLLGSSKFALTLKKIFSIMNEDIELEHDENNLAFLSP